MFCVLPFGLASACYVFTKLLRPLVKRWRSLGLHVFLYIDDGIFVHQYLRLSQLRTGRLLCLIWRRLALF